MREEVGDGKFFTTSVARAKALIVALLVAASVHVKKTAWTLKNRYVQFRYKRQLKHKTVIIPYSPEWQSSMISSSYKTSTQTFSTFRVLLRLTQIFGSFPVKNLSTLGTQEQERKFRMKKLSFIFVYSLIVPLFPTCYMVYEMNAPALVEELDDGVPGSPISTRSSNLTFGQTRFMTVVITGLIPFQVWFECTFHAWRTVKAYPGLLMKMLPACRELDLSWRKQARLAFRSIQPLLVPMVVSLSCLAYPTVFKTSSFRATFRHCLIPTWIYLLVFSSPDVVFSATCVLAEALLHRNFLLFQNAIEKAIVIRKNSVSHHSKLSVLLKEIRKRQSVHFTLCDCVDKIEKMYANIYRFDFVLSLATMIIYGYLAFVHLMKRKYADSFAAFFRGFFCLLRIFHVIKAAAGPQIKSERMLKRLSGVATEVHNPEIQHALADFLVKTRLTPVRLMDTVYSGQHRSAFTLIVGATVTSLVVLIQPFLDTSSMYQQRHSTGDALSDILRNAII